MKIKVSDFATWHNNIVNTASSALNCLLNFFLYKNGNPL